jgi:hypothetical protein
MEGPSFVKSTFRASYFRKIAGALTATFLPLAPPYPFIHLFFQMDI